jgi:hypothetical protein
MRSVIDHVWARVQNTRLVAAVVAVVIITDRQGWIGFVSAAPMAVLLLVLEERHVDDDIACAKCLHRKDDHNGNCQECLRQQVRGELTRTVPCSRFGRTVLKRRSVARADVQETRGTVS